MESSTSDERRRHHHSHQRRPQDLVSSSMTSRATSDSDRRPNGVCRGRKLLIIRHGERVDFTFSSELWMSKAFDAHGRYQRYNINMPRSIPTRKDGHLGYSLDTPLTEIGYLQAKLTGRALKDSGTKPTYVYASPAYRCVQTCVGVLKGMQSQNQTVTFNIEPGLFEWGGWFRHKMPSWMTPEEYLAQGYPVNVTYKPIIARSEISSDESLLDYYHRSFLVTQKILDQHKEDCVILFVAHGASLETCTRQLCGGAPRPQQDFYVILHQTPYLAMACATESGNSFKLADPPILPFQHGNNAAFDWHLLQGVTVLNKSH